MSNDGFALLTLTHSKMMYSLVISAVFLVVTYSNYVAVHGEICLSKFFFTGRSGYAAADQMYTVHHTTIRSTASGRKIQRLLPLSEFSAKYNARRKREDSFLPKDLTTEEVFTILFCSQKLASQVL